MASRCAGKVARLTPKHPRCLYSRFPSPLTLLSRSAQVSAASSCIRHQVRRVSSRSVDEPPAKYVALMQHILQLPDNVAKFEYDTVTYIDCWESLREAWEAGVPRGETTLPHRPLFDAKIIYEVGCITNIAFGDQAHPMTLAAWASSSFMGYVPATITLAHQLVVWNCWGKWSHCLKEQARFQALVAKGKDPNALAVEGGRLFNEKKKAQSLATLKEALRLGGSDFHLKPLCHLYLGRLAKENGKMEAAQRAFEKSYDMYPAESALELGDMFSSTDLEKSRLYYMRAGIRLKPEAYSHLALLELGSSTNETDEARAKEHHFLALELQRLYDYAPVETVWKKD